MIYDDFGCLVGRVLFVECFYKVFFGVYKVEVDVVVDQVILVWFDFVWCVEINLVGFVYGFDLVVCVCQIDKFGMEFGKIFF